MMFNAWAKSPNGIHSAISLFCETQLAEFNRNDIHVCMCNEIIAFQIKYRKSFFFQKKYVKLNQYQKRKRLVLGHTNTKKEKNRNQFIAHQKYIYYLFYGTFICKANHRQ